MEVAVVPLGWVGRPGTFDAAGDSVATNTTGDVVHPAKALLRDVCAFGGRPKVFGASITVRLTNGVTTGGQCNGLFVVHGHAGKGFANLSRGLQRVRVVVNALRVHVDETHLNGR